MKKLILAIIVGLAFNVSAQVTNLFWTNGVTIYTNVTIGTKTYPFTSNQWLGLKWSVDQANKAAGLDQLPAAQRYDVKDIIGMGAWYYAETVWAPQAIAAAQAEAEAKANVRKLIDLLRSNTLTDAQIAKMLTDATQ